MNEEKDQNESKAKEYLLLSVLENREEIVLQLSHVMGKPAFYISINKGTNQLRGKNAADQHLCFCYIFVDNTIQSLYFLNPKFQAFSRCL